MNRAIVVGAVALVGCSNASLADMRPGLVGNGLQCMMTLKFNKRPKAGDVKDVKVTFSSIVLTADQTFDWAYITEHDQRLIKGTDDYSVPDKYQPNTDTTAESEPEVGTPMIVQFFLDAHKEVQVKSGDDTALNATLYWAGKKEDAASRGLFLAYQRK